MAVAIMLDAAQGSFDCISCSAFAEQLTSLRMTVERGLQRFAEDNDGRIVARPKAWAD